MISITEAAKRLGISRQRLAILCKQRRIPGAKLIGRLWFLPDIPEITPKACGPKLKGQTPDWREALAKYTKGKQ